MHTSNDENGSLKVLILAGESFFSYPIFNHFYEKSKNFFLSVFNASSISELNKLYKLSLPSGISLFIDPTETEKTCYYGAIPILHHECVAAGYSSIVASIREFFYISNNGQLAVSECWADVLKKIDVIALSTSLIISPDGAALRRIVTFLKESGKPIVIGGILSSHLTLETLNTIPFDCCIRGSAEGKLSELLRVLKSSNRSLLKSIPGLIWREDGVLNFSSLPDTLTSFESYFAIPDKNWIQSIQGIYPYESVRGCVYKCSFCDYPYFMGGSFHFKSAKQMLKEWLFLADLGVKNFSIFDSTFTSPLARTKEFCGLLIKSKLNGKITWSCFARASHLVVPGIVELMQKAGCTFVFIGAESGDQGVLNHMNKATTIEENALAIKLCNQSELYSGAAIMLGFPGETEQSFNNTRDFLLEQASPSLYLGVWVPDFKVNSKVPIMQEAKLKEHNLVAEIKPTVFPVNFYGETFDYHCSFNWHHKTMDFKSATTKLFTLANMVARNEIHAEDQKCAPYQVFLRSAIDLSSVLSFREMRKILWGIKGLFGRYNAGEDLDALKSAAKQLLNRL